MTDITVRLVTGQRMGVTVNDRPGHRELWLSFGWSKKHHSQAAFFSARDARVHISPASDRPGLSSVMINESLIVTMSNSEADRIASMLGIERS